MNHLKTHQTNPTTAQYRPVQSNTSTAQYSQVQPIPEPDPKPELFGQTRPEPDPKSKSPTRQSLVTSQRVALLRRRPGSSGRSASRALATTRATSLRAKNAPPRRTPRLVKLDAPPQRVAVSSRSRRLEPAAIFPLKMLNSPMRRVWWEGLPSVTQVG